MKYYDLIIIGGGPAGLAAAIAAKNSGIDDILILEREESLGGILNQCIHTGFGMHIFKENLTGPEYIQKFKESINGFNINYKLNTTVLEIDENKYISAVNPVDGMFYLQSKAIILATGSRERPRGSFNIPGSKCAGIYTAGTVQKFINIEGYMPGKEIVILGSGDVALNMARRMTLEGGKVRAVIESMPYYVGKQENVIECLDQFDIPLKLNHTVTNIKGRERVEGVTVAQVDSNKNSISGTEQFISCDTVVLSVNLRADSDILRDSNVELNDLTWGPEVGESLQTTVDGIFACGNVIHIYESADKVSKEGYIAGKNAALYIQEKRKYNCGKKINLKNTKEIRYFHPNFIYLDNLEECVEIKVKIDRRCESNELYIYEDNDKNAIIKTEICTLDNINTIEISKELIKNCNENLILQVK